MDVPYIKLSQAGIMPAVLQEILDICWYQIKEENQTEIIDLLKSKDVKYEI